MNREGIMKESMRALAVAVLGACLAASAIGAEGTGQERAEAAGRGLVGAAAPRMQVHTIDGRTIDLGSLYGKQAVYLKFWATWCVPCREQMPHFEHVYETAGPDLAVIAVNAAFNDSVEEIRQYRKRLGITMPIVFDEDGRLAEAFNLRVTPQHVVIGRDGRIQYVGHLADAQLDAALLAARSAPASAVAGAAGRAGASGGGRHVANGDLLPDARLDIIDGDPVMLREHGAAGPTVLVFLSPWCESYLATTRPAVSRDCRVAREQVELLKRDHHVRWLGVASGLWASPNDMREYREKYKVTIPLTLDESGTLFREFRVTDTPTLVLADSQGRIVRRMGAASAAGLTQALRGL
jgi:peroxiredoxin